MLRGLQCLKVQMALSSDTSKCSWQFCPHSPNNTSARHQQAECAKDYGTEATSEPINYRDSVLLPLHMALKG